MLFHAAGAEGSRPTFFEMPAADYLPASLKAAALYALGVLAQQRPSLHRLLDYSDELTAAAMMLLEWHSLKTHGASFGESMYGLRRFSTATPRSPPTRTLGGARMVGGADRAGGGAEGAGRGAGDGGSPSHGMSSRQQLLSLLALVLLPYLRAKLLSLFAARQRQRQARALWVGGEAGEGGGEEWGGMGEGEWGTELGRGDGDAGGYAEVDGDGDWDGDGGTRGGMGHGDGDSSSSSPGLVNGRQVEGGGVSASGIAERVAGPVERAGEGAGGEAADVPQGRETQGAARGSVASRSGGGVRGGSANVGGSRSGRSSRAWKQVLRLLRLLQRRAVRVAAVAYPWLQAPFEGVCLLYQLLYAMDATPYYAPLLHLLSLSLRRATPQELAEASSSVSARREREFEQLPGPPALRAIQAALLKALYLSMDYAQTSVIAAVFAFKMAEWWFQTGEQKLSAPTVYPPPPPPPPPKVAPGGIPVPSDPRLCPLCLCRRANPTAPATSGFLFCYPCIFAYVDKFARCPITHHPTTAEQLRRLFPDA